MYIVKDVSDWVHRPERVSQGMHESAWIVSKVGRTALFKYSSVRDGVPVKAHITEKLAYELSKAVRIKCAEIDLAKKNRRVGCLSYDFLNKDDRFQDGLELIRSIRPEFQPKDLISEYAKEDCAVSLFIDSVRKLNLGEESFKSIKVDMLKMFLFDYLIANYDRGITNWGVITNRFNTVSLSPLFDHESSFGLLLPKKVTDEYLINKDRVDFNMQLVPHIHLLFNYWINHERLVEHIVNNYYDETRDFIETIIREVTDESVTNILNNFEDHILDPSDKELVKEVVLRRKEILKKVTER